MGKFTNIILWIVFILALLNSFMIGAGAKSAIQQIYGGISSIVATLIFCTIVIRSTIKEESEYIATAIRKVKDATVSNGEEIENIKNIMNKDTNA